MKHRKYMDIERMKDSNCLGFNAGDHIVIQEKIDGANAAVRYDSETDSLAAQSRNQLLSEDNTLRGFQNWVQTLDKELIKSVLGNDLIAYCEWLVPHSVKYPEERYYKAYFYDVFDRRTGMYLSQNEVRKITDKLGLTYVPVFYDGEFISWSHCSSFVGKTELGGEYGEGVVIKNQSRLGDVDSPMPYYIKIVDERFAETTGQHHNRNLIFQKEREPDPNTALAMTIVTKARVEKILNKLVDEGILPENWGQNEMKIIVGNLTKAVYEDCLKEEPETVRQIEGFGKAANTIAIKLVKSIILNKLK